MSRGRQIDSESSKQEFRIRFDRAGKILGQSLNSPLAQRLGLHVQDAAIRSVFRYLTQLGALDPALPARLVRRTRKLLEDQEEFSVSGDVFVGDIAHHIRISGQAIRNVDGETSYTLLILDDTEHTHLRRMYEYMFRLANHELKGPLASIMGAAEFAEQHAREGNMDGVKASLDMIMRNAEVIDEMIVRYLNLSRIESGLIRINASNILVSEDVLRPILNQMKPALAKRSMEVEFECRGFDHEPMVYADAEKVDIVLRYLLSNALKYGTPSTAIEVYAHPAEGSVAISVENQGPTFPRNIWTAFSSGSCAWKPHRAPRGRDWACTMRGKWWRCGAAL